MKKLTNKYKALLDVLISLGDSINNYKYILNPSIKKNLYYFNQEQMERMSREYFRNDKI